MISIHALLAESDGILLTLTIGFSGFLSTLSLRRATAINGCNSDIEGFLSTLSLRRATDIGPLMFKVQPHFYPRSPCGERRNESSEDTHNGNFYPRSPCGERQRAENHANSQQEFLSTLSLRRATSMMPLMGAILILFLSTLSLRRATASNQTGQQEQHISIHALLAESDNQRFEAQMSEFLFLSTLSLRRATTF